MAVFVANESGAPADEEELAELCRFVLTALGVDPLVELSVLLVDVATMTQLHQRWMGEPGPTDVLAFPMDELSSQADFAADFGDPEQGELTLLGDVVLCPEVAQVQAGEQGHSVGEELAVLTAHGILHLLGYDHGDPEEGRAMFTRQTDVLAAWYRDGPAGLALGRPQRPAPGRPAP